MLSVYYCWQFQHENVPWTIVSEAIVEITFPLLHPTQLHFDTRDSPWSLSVVETVIHLLVLLYSLGMLCSHNSRVPALQNIREQGTNARIRRLVTLNHGCTVTFSYVPRRTIRDGQQRY